MKRKVGLDVLFGEASTPDHLYFVSRFAWARILALTILRVSYLEGCRGTVLLVRTRTSNFEKGTNNPMDPAVCGKPG
jgi:hypothetical protein